MTDTPSPEPLAVSQEDREAARNLAGTLSALVNYRVTFVSFAHGPMAQAFAAHRLAATRAGSVEDALTILTTALYDAENTSRLSEHPEEVPAYRARAASILQWIEALGGRLTAGNSERGDDVETVAQAIYGVKGGLNYNYMDFCRDAARAALSALAPRDAVPPPPGTECVWPAGHGVGTGEREEIIAWLRKQADEDTGLEEHILAWAALQIEKGAHVRSQGGAG